MDAVTALVWAIVGAVISLFFAALFQNPLNRLVDKGRFGFRESRVGRRIISSAARERRYRDFLSRDSEQDGVFTLHRWSPERQLQNDPRLHRIDFGTPPDQDWFDNERLEKAQEIQSITRKGLNGYIYDMTVDHHEHIDADKVIMRAGRSNYGDLNAIGDCLSGIDSVEFVGRRLHEKGSIEFLRTMPATRLVCRLRS